LGSGSQRRESRRIRPVHPVTLTASPQRPLPVLFNPVRGYFAYHAVPNHVQALQATM
jgi:hypothetical protein